MGGSVGERHLSSVGCTLGFDSLVSCHHVHRKDAGISAFSQTAISLIGILEESFAALELQQCTINLMFVCTANVLVSHELCLRYFLNPRAPWHER